MDDYLIVIAGDWNDADYVKSVLLGDEEWMEKVCKAWDTLISVRERINEQACSGTYIDYASYISDDEIREVCEEISGGNYVEEDLGITSEEAEQISMLWNNYSPSCPDGEYVHTLSYIHVYKIEKQIR